MDSRRMDDNPDMEKLRRENESLLARLQEYREAHEIVRAIRKGEVDALVIGGPKGDRIYTLQSAEQPYRMLIEQMQEGAITLVQDGTIHYANRAFAEMIERPLEQVIGSAVRDYVAEADRSLYDALMQQCLSGSSRGELSLQAVGGTLLPAYLSLSLLVVDGGASVCMVITDLTEQKRSEEVLASERLSRAILNQAADAIVVCDAQGRLTFANAAARLQARLDPDDASLDIGRQIWGQAYGVDGLPLPAEQWPVSMALRGRGVSEREMRIVRPDGGEQDILLSASPLREADGAIIGAVATFSDITARKRAEKALAAAKVSAEQAKAVAEAASKAKDHFLAVLSHELRNPLNPVLATATMLQKDRRFDADTREQLEVIRRNAELEARLIDDLLDVTRIERGKVELDRRPIDLGTVIRSAAEVCMPDIEARKLKFDIDTSDGPYWVHADAARLQQVFWNLLKNSVKFTPTGGRVSIRCRSDSEGFVIAEVKDSGVGIEAEALPRLFNAFEQAERSITRQFGGLGLGLTISKAMVEMHGGTIAAHSEGKGRGATFTVRLPLLPAEAVAASAPSTPATRQVAALGRSLRILLVEDHDDTARIMRRLLEAGGHTIQTATDVATALRLAGEQSFDLLLSDLGLPDGSGLDLMRALQAKGTHLPGIVLSGYGQDQDVQQSREAGFAAHLVKPVNIPQVEEVIARIFAGRR